MRFKSIAISRWLRIFSRMWPLPTDVCIIIMCATMEITSLLTTVELFKANCTVASRLPLCNACIDKWSDQIYAWWSSPISTGHALTGWSDDREMESGHFVHLALRAFIGRDDIEQMPLSAIITGHSSSVFVHHFDQFASIVLVHVLSPFIESILLLYTI